ncbi:MAG: tetratricopeptide repeat protein [Planctomycetaceae bacterium]|nr:tetratricopeptide repeat protein [Planctomycetaceae bacterium]
MRPHCASASWTRIPGVAAGTLLFALLGTVSAQPTLQSARELELAGKLTEAAEQYEALPAADAIEKALGRARIDAARGQRAAAAERLQRAIGEHAESAPLQAAAARMAWERGDWDTARSAVAAALKLQPDHVAARLLDAELLEATGDLEGADAGYKWLVDYYNDHDQASAAELLAIGRGAAQYARWHRLSDQFSFLINTLYPEVLEREPQGWQAHWESGRLFLEKHNVAAAAKEFAAALKINPRAAEVYASLAHLALEQYNVDDARAALERALELNPELVAAWHAKADLALANFDAPGALAILEQARQLNPRDEETLARIGAALVLLDGLPEPDATDARLHRLCAEVDARNPHAGRFYYTLGTRLEERRQFAAAERYFRRALERIPLIVGPQAGLGMMFMRLGREEEAKPLLDTAFEIDPFNVRVKNTLEVLDVLTGYETLETEHFRIKFDPAQDKLLARYVAQELERVFPELCAQFGYTPPEKTLFEIFSSARNTKGHGWFSARMVGLPSVGTVGACAGKMVALTSPNDLQTKYNWARVVKHEFIHVINLQQTNYNVPHWFTEALAVVNEGYPRSETWNQLLLERVPAGKAFTLDNINLGFIRPESGADWQMAYCQAEIYAEYLREKYGPDAIARLLTAFAENQNTGVAIERALGISQAEFDAGYQERLKQIVAELKPGVPQAEMKLAELERALKADPQNPGLMARLAQAELARGAYPEARKYARQALQLDPREQLAAYVVARLHLLVGDTAEALKTLEGALDAEAPQANLIALLAGLKLKAEDYDAAARLYRLAADREPENPTWQKSLARVYLLAKQSRPLAEVLTRLAEMDADDVNIRKKLAQLAFEARDLPEAARWARRALEIDLLDAEIHGILAQALSDQNQFAEGIAEYDVALELAPDKLGWQFGLADALVQAGQPQRAREVLRKLLAADPDYPGADTLLESLAP